VHTLSKHNFRRVKTLHSVACARSLFDFTPTANCLNTAEELFVMRMKAVD